jgi:predicted  nucleic acid-binding Zn-ribbon protein
MFSIKQLYQLQELDQEMSSREELLKNVRCELADDEVVNHAKNTVGKIESDIAHQTTARRDIELSIQQIQNKIDIIDGKLYGGTILNPKELSAYETERNFLQQQHTPKEDKLLELLVSIDECHMLHKTAQSKLGEIERNRDIGHSLLRESEQAILDKLTHQAMFRKETIRDIDPLDLSLYESLRKVRKDQAVAKVERGKCQGCHLTLSLAELKRIKNSIGFVQCSSCKRILYLS